jgi:hypothetical protein
MWLQCTSLGLASVKVTEHNRLEFKLSAVEYSNKC